MSTSDPNLAAERTKHPSELAADLSSYLTEILNSWRPLSAKSSESEIAHPVRRHKLEAWFKQVGAAKAFRDKENAPVVFMSLGPTEMQSQVEMLKSLVVQERRTAARATRLHDQLQAHHDATQNKMLDRLAQRDAANSTLQAALAGKANDRLRMTESYEGEVIHVLDNSVIVVYDVRDDLIEQTYVREQFLDGQLPQKGDRLAAYIYIAKLPLEPEVLGYHDEDSDDVDDAGRRWKNAVSLPLTL